MITIGSSSLRDLPKIRNAKRKRVSSWDLTGGNDDRLHIEADEMRTIADIKGAGCITHIWITMDCKEKYFLRKVLLKMYWDGEREPSVEVPIGDFFGIGHGITKNFVSLPLTMSPQDGKAFNCFFPMPFSEGARIEVINECSKEELIFYYYVDYEEYDKLGEELGRFHAQWRRVNPCRGIPEAAMTNEDFQFGGKNLTGKDNYVILEAEGKGHYVGCSLNIHNLRETDKWNWYGEGDDMIFIDGEKWPPTLHGTGTEDYFNTAWCPNQEFSAPYHGIPLAGGPNWSGKITLYRFHIEDPICFEKSIRVTIEHGHANRRSDDYSSVAYWYQIEPHKKFPETLSVEKRLPREDKI
jgi:hypothetical protein